MPSAVPLAAGARRVAVTMRKPFTALDVQCSRRGLLLAGLAQFTSMQLHLVDELGDGADLDMLAHLRNHNVRMSQMALLLTAAEPFCRRSPPGA